MEQILPALERQLRRFRHQAAWLAAHRPHLASQLGGPHGAPDVHVDRLAQGVASLHARSALALHRARCQQDEHLLERHYPEQLRPFPECRIGPGRGGHGAAKIVSARYLPRPDAAIELGLALGPSAAGTLDIYIDGDAGFSAALRSALLAGGGSGPPAQVRAAGGAPWRALPRWPIGPSGMDPAEALLPRAPGGHAGLALLREFFIFPARFNVLRLDLSLFGGAGYWTLRLPVAAAQLLDTLRASHLRAGWRASACLQRMAAAPVILDGVQCEYMVSVPPALEIFSIDSVRVAGAERRDWVARRVEDAPPGHEWRIAFPAVGTEAVASIDVTCCRRAGRAPAGS